MTRSKNEPQVEKGPRGLRRGRGARERILSASQQLFRDQGINCTGVNELCAVAEVSKRTLYQHFTGGKDGQFGDIMFTMERMKFVGQPVNLDTDKAPYGGSHRFYSLTAGHSGFPNGFPGPRPRAAAAQGQAQREEHQEVASGL